MIFIFRDSDELVESPCMLESNSWKIMDEGQSVYLTLYDDDANVPYRIFDMTGYDNAKFMDEVFVQMITMETNIDMLTVVERAKAAALPPEDPNQISIDLGEIKA